jgi:undecaprenyl pyrophosphate phosphatase UppP
MKSSIKRSTDFYKRYQTIQFMVYPLMVIVGLLTIKWLFGNSLSMSLFWVAFCVICFVAELWMTKMVRFKTLENNDLLTLSNHARSFKKLYAIFVVSYVIPIIIIVVGGIVSETGINYSFESSIIAFCFVLVFSVVVAWAEVRYKTRPCDEIIRQIEAFETTTNKETGLNKKQQWFCVAMIVAFIGLDVWAYTIVGSRLKLPLMWQTK